MNLSKFSQEVNKAKDRQTVQLGQVMLSDVKTLDKYVSQADKLADKMRKLKNKWTDLELKYEDLNDKHIEADNKYEDQKDNIVALRKKHNAAEDKAEGVQQKLFDAANKIEQQADKAWTSAENAKGDLRVEKDTAGALVDKFTNGIEQFKKAAAALGVKVDISKYESARNRLDATTMVKI